MKRIFLILLTLSSASAFAAVEMRFAPASPAVFRASTRTPDGVPVRGPYFINQFNFNSDREAAIEKFTVSASLPTGAATDYEVVLAEPLVVHPGITAHTGILYFGGLPFSRVLTYQITVHAYGTFADGAPLEIKGSFLTQ